MSPLKEDLAELADAVPALRQHASETIGRAHGLADAATALLQEIADARDEATSFLTSSRNAMPAFKNELEELDKRQQDAGDAAEKAWSEASDGLGGAEQALHDAGGQVASAQAGLLHGVFAAATRVDQASVAGTDAVQRLGGAAGEGATRLRAAAEAASKEAAALHELLDQTKQSVSEAEHGLLERMVQLAAAAQADAAALVEKLERRHQEHRTNLQAPLDALGGQLSAIEDGWETRLHDAVRAPVLQAEESARTALQELAGEAEQREAAVREAQAAQDASLALLEEAAGHLPDGIRQINEAMEKLQ